MSVLERRALLELRELRSGVRVTRRTSTRVRMVVLLAVLVPVLVLRSRLLSFGRRGGRGLRFGLLLLRLRDIRRWLRARVRMHLRRAVLGVIVHVMRVLAHTRVSVRMRVRPARSV